MLRQRSRDALGVVVRQGTAAFALDRRQHLGVGDAAEAILQLLLADRVPAGSECLRMNAVSDRLAVDQHAVAVEDDQIEATCGHWDRGVATRLRAGRSTSGSTRRRHPGRGQRRMLAGGQRRFVEILDQLVEQAVPVDLGLQMHEHRAEPDRGPVHKHKLARRPNPAEPANVAVHAFDHRGAIGPVRLFLDQPRSIVEQRAIDKPRPTVQHLDHLA